MATAASFATVRGPAAAGRASYDRVSFFCCTARIAWHFNSGLLDYLF